MPKTGKNPLRRRARRATGFITSRPQWSARTPSHRYTYITYRVEWVSRRFKVFSGMTLREFGAQDAMLDLTTPTWRFECTGM